LVVELFDEQLRDASRVDRRGLRKPRDARVGQGDHHTYNVGRSYAAFASDIDNGTHAVPDFADAFRRHEVIAAIERSAASGERVNA
jgi:predicted dehydrogenase